MPGEVNGFKHDDSYSKTLEIGHCVIAITNELVSGDTLSIEPDRLAIAQGMLIEEEPGGNYIFLCQKLGCQAMCGLKKNTTHYTRTFDPPRTECWE